jgi:hypothetical protein
MNLERAYKILGEGLGTSGVFFDNMIRALKMHRWLNTPEEESRLEAALWVRRHRKQYNAYLDTKRDERFSTKPLGSHKR